MESVWPGSLQSSPLTPLKVSSVLQMGELPRGVTLNFIYMPETTEHVGL